jgi:hypothetical protein
VIEAEKASYPIKRICAPVGGVALGVLQMARQPRWWADPGPAPRIRADLHAGGAVEAKYPKPRYIVERVGKGLKA